MIVELARARISNRKVALYNPQTRRQAGDIGFDPVAFDGLVDAVWQKWSGSPRIGIGLDGTL